MKSLKYYILGFILAFVLANCSDPISHIGAPSLVGIWQRIEGPYNETLKLAENGTFAIDGNSLYTTGQYYVLEPDTLVIRFTSVNCNEEKYTYTLTNNTLVIYNREMLATEYERLN